MGQPPAGPLAARQRRARLWSVVALFGALALCSLGGTFAWITVETVTPRGSAAPSVALEGFLDAVFVEQSISAATGYVCADGRADPNLAQLVYVAKVAAQHGGYQARWSYPAIPAQGPTATTEVNLVLTSAEQQVIGERRLKVKLTNDHGWWVCRVNDGD